MAKNQTTHPIYELKVDTSNTSRLFEYYMLKDYIKKEHVVLDIGCNTGTGMDILSMFSDYVYGIDVIPELEQILTEKYRENNKIHFKIVKEGEITFENSFFDVIVANNFIEHVKYPHFYLEKFSKLLKPNGTLFLTTVNREHRLYPWQKPYNPHHYTEYSVKSLKKILKKHFNNIECKGIIKKTPFFPDYITEASSRKFRMGIKYPILNFLKNIKNIFFETKKQSVSRNENDIPNTKIPLEKFNIDDFKEAFKYLEIDSNNESKWIELFTICRKN